MDLTAFTALAIDHVKSDGDDANLLIQYINSAIATASGYCQRNLYWDADTMAADKATYPAQITAIETTFNTARETYKPLHCGQLDPTQRLQDNINAQLLDAAWRTYIDQRAALKRMTDGILIDDAVVAALLLITGHLYRNRQEVIAETGAAAVQLPMGAARILDPKVAN